MIKPTQEVLLPLVNAGVLSSNVRFEKLFPSDSNQCWLVTEMLEDGEEKPWVIKKLREDSLSVNWSRYIENTEQAVQYGLTPEVHYFDYMTGWMMMPYRPVENLLLSKQPIEDKVKLCATLLSKIHATQCDFPVLNVFEEVMYYMTFINDQKIKSQMIDRMNDLPVLPYLAETESKSQLVPCHLDLSFANILCNGEVLDWEYSRLALPVVDLAFCATINQLDGSQSLLLLNAYADRSNTRPSEELFLLYCEWSQLLNDVWYCVAEQSESERL